MFRAYPESVFKYPHHSVEGEDHVCERKKPLQNHFLIATPLKQTATALSA